MVHPSERYSLCGSSSGIGIVAGQGRIYFDKVYGCEKTCVPFFRLIVLRLGGVAKTSKSPLATLGLGSSTQHLVRTCFCSIFHKQHRQSTRSTSFPERWRHWLRGPSFGISYPSLQWNHTDHRLFAILSFHSYAIFVRYDRLLSIFLRAMAIAIVFSSTIARARSVQISFRKLGNAYWIRVPQWSPICFFTV